MGRMTRRRRIVMSAAAMYALGLVLLALGLHQSSPGPVTQEVTGVGIGSALGDAGARRDIKRASDTKGRAAA